MFELGTGIFFALWSIGFYLIIVRLSKPDKRGRAVWRSLITPTPLDALKPTAAKSSAQAFLTTAELSEHHSHTASRELAGRDRDIENRQRPLVIESNVRLGNRHEDSA